MLAVVNKYLNALFTNLPYLSEVLGMVDVMEVNGVKAPAQWVGGEPQHISFDSKESFICVLKDGEVDRETIEHPSIACKEQVSETYPMKAVLYWQGVQDINCSSVFYGIVEGVKKNISGNQKQLSTTINSEKVIIKVKKTNLNSGEVYKVISSADAQPKETDHFASIDFDVTITGDEQCFAGEPCTVPDFTFSFPAISLCEAVRDCTGDGVQSKEFTGNGTTTIQDNDLIGKEILLIDTDGRIRKSSDYTFTSSTGTTVFASAIQVTQKGHWLYK